MSGSSIIGKNWRRNSLQWSGHVFEAIGLNILDHLVRVEHFTIHGDINSGWFALDGAQGAADIEDGVGLGKDCRLQGTGQHDTLVGDTLQGHGRGHHAVAAMGESELDHSAMILALEKLAEHKIGD